MSCPLSVMQLAKRAIVLVMASGAFTQAAAQAPTPDAGSSARDRLSRWSVDIETSLYIWDDDLLLLPIVSADRGRVHLEGRFQYEDEKTLSFWAGPRFEIGSSTRLEIVPMAGAVVGRTNGVAPGLELTLSWKRLEFYSENEYVFDLNKVDGSFGFTWTELSVQPVDGLWLGVSGQGTREHGGERWIDRGMFASVSVGPADVSVYWFNPGSPTRFAIVMVEVGF